ncbi:hypothetical protein ACEWY4_003330 [Coilia grayii]|uniref:Heme-binding protein 1 n=1 Tax=Coilia grayii TaxID=363190 RepID=A0ABD1KQZ9_9TELE
MVVLACALAVEARVGDSAASSFCTETKECLLYTSICSGDEYEVRHYDSAKWVSAVEESFFMDMAITRAFWKLFKYIQGNNAAGMKIDMTAPVIIKTKEGTSMWKSSEYTVSFLLPSAFQQGQDAPAPTDKGVFFNTMPDMKVYVKSYGGWLMGVTSSKNAQDLKRSLHEAGASYNQDFHYDVGYDSPMKMRDRHNEVWYQVKGDHVCPSGAN